MKNNHKYRGRKWTLAKWMIAALFTTISLASGLVGYAIYKGEVAGIIGGTITYFSLVTLGEIAFLERYCKHNVEQKIKLKVNEKGGK